MNIFIYSDESGVFDYKHNDYFVFGGVIFLSKDEKSVWERKYIHAENTIRSIENLPRQMEVKATNITPKSKYKLYRSLSAVEKFGVVVSQKALRHEIFEDKKTKQRYLDWVYKMAIKNKFLNMISNKRLKADDVENLFFYVDEHTTATKGKYELRESIEQEFKIGTFNYTWSTFYEPIFPKLHSLDLKYCNSSSKTLVRAADIVANHLFHIAIENNGKVSPTSNMTIYKHP